MAGGQLAGGNDGQIPLPSGNEVSQAKARRPYLPTLPGFPVEYRKTGPATGLPEIL